MTTIALQLARRTAALLFLLAPLAVAQTYRVAGIVLSSTEGQPLARARLTLADQRTGRPIATMLTTDDGHFEFTSLPAGKYPLTAAKRGYLTSAYNQHDQFSTAIVTGAGVDTEHLTFRLPPLAQIYGQVLDEHGDPVRKARITLWHDDHSAGVSRTTRSGQDTTDDVGYFEFSTIRPNTYFLSVTAEPWYAVHPKPNAIDVDRSLDVVYPTTYYSGATESEDATPILVRAGDHLQLDLHLLPVAPIHILFRTPTDGTFATPMLFKRVFDDLDLPDRQDGNMVSPGVYEILTAPGRFRAQLPATKNSPARTTDVDLGQDNQELDVSAGEPTASFIATCEINGASQFPDRLILSLRDTNGRLESNQIVDPKTGAIFNELRPGKYSLSAFAGNQAYAISTIAPLNSDHSRGKPVATHTIDLAPGSERSFALTLIAGSTTVEGFVQHNGKPFDGAMVVLVPTDPKANLEFFRRDQSDLDGSFVLPRVAPGNYTAVAIEDGWDLDWSKPAVIASYAKNGEKLTIPPDTKTFHVPSPLEPQPK
jgi:Carboxypeptidase regulatory-like domain